ncbi:hypothetical protein A2U01_0093461, partial [Trifolium medium]|nr:hypothetical protein [Trifolium medium]
MVRNLTNGSAAEKITIGLTPSSAVTLIPTAEVTQAQDVNHAATGSGTKIVYVPKKRMRIAQGGNDTEAEVN